MKLRIAPALLVSGFCLLSVSALADSHGMTSKQLAEDKKCLACHAISESVDTSIIPTFQQISSRYSMSESERLVQVILTGGEDHWGTTEMPDMGVRTDVTREQAEQLVNWILTIKE